MAKLYALGHAKTYNSNLSLSKKPKHVCNRKQLYVELSCFHECVGETRFDECVGWFLNTPMSPNVGVWLCLKSNTSLLHTENYVLCIIL